MERFVWHVRRGPYQVCDDKQEETCRISYLSSVISRLQRRFPHSYHWAIRGFVLFSTFILLSYTIFWLVFYCHITVLSQVFLKVFLIAESLTANSPRRPQRGQPLYTVFILPHTPHFSSHPTILHIFLHTAPFYTYLFTPSPSPILHISLHTALIFTFFTLESLITLFLFFCFLFFHTRTFSTFLFTRPPFSTFLFTLPPFSTFLFTLPSFSTFLFTLPPFSTFLFTLAHSPHFSSHSHRSPYFSSLSHILHISLHTHAFSMCRSYVSMSFTLWTSCFQNAKFSLFVSLPIRPFIGRHFVLRDRWRSTNIVVVAAAVAIVVAI